MKNQISALSDPFPSLDNLKKNWCGRLMAKIFTFNSTNVINYTICILLVSQNYFCITKYMIEPSTEMMTRLEAVDQMYSSIYDQ